MKNNNSLDLSRLYSYNLLRTVIFFSLGLGFSKVIEVIRDLLVKTNEKDLLEDSQNLHSKVKEYVNVKNPLLMRNNLLIYLLIISIIVLFVYRIIQFLMIVPLKTLLNSIVYTLFGYNILDYSEVLYSYYIPQIKSWLNENLGFKFSLPLNIPPHDWSSLQKRLEDVNEVLSKVREIKSSIPEVEVEELYEEYDNEYDNEGEGWSTYEKVLLGVCILLIGTSVVLYFYGDVITDYLKPKGGSGGSSGSVDLSNTEDMTSSTQTVRPSKRNGFLPKGNLSQTQIGDPLDIKLRNINLNERVTGKLREGYIQLNDIVLKTLKDQSTGEVVKVLDNKGNWIDSEKSLSKISDYISSNRVRNNYTQYSNIEGVISIENIDPSKGSYYIGKDLMLWKENEMLEGSSKELLETGSKSFKGIIEYGKSTFNMYYKDLLSDMKDVKLNSNSKLLRLDTNLANKLGEVRINKSPIVLLNDIVNSNNNTPILDYYYNKNPRLNITPSTTPILDQYYHKSPLIDSNNRISFLSKVNKFDRLDIEITSTDVLGNQVIKPLFWINSNKLIKN